MCGSLDVSSQLLPLLASGGGTWERQVNIVRRVGRKYFSNWIRQKFKKSHTIMDNLCSTFLYELTFHLYNKVPSLSLCLVTHKETRTWARCHPQAITVSGSPHIEMNAPSTPTPRAYEQLSCHHAQHSFTTRPLWTALPSGKMWQLHPIAFCNSLFQSS